MVIMLRVISQRVFVADAVRVHCVLRFSVGGPPDPADPLEEPEVEEVAAGAGALAALAGAAAGGTGADAAALATSSLGIER